MSFVRATFSGAETSFLRAAFSDKVVDFDRADLGVPPSSILGRVDRLRPV
ncbi:hypothetical protein EV384_0054 [Micromonospora kangleipakensis]|uniref:Uncharacterized protein n=1 Tax=Micromonospora kangleipakensis TaxID=1077942 RepID=A0A4Q8B453_9ACTN|nr:hypothetical protein EV384_0054 [Micromonospora kangleipakensis]